MLTVLFATHNRAGLLNKVLESFEYLESPPGGWKLVVVNNASSDNTAKILEAFKESLPITILYEPKKGKNHALNTGLKLLEGDLVVLTDDDVFPRPDWLINLRKGADTQPEYAVFGGGVIPRWETKPPSWIKECVPQGPAFTLTDTELKDGPINASNVFGPNMALRSYVFDCGYIFNTDIGPKGKTYPMGSETELVRRLLNGGFAAWHVSNAVVEHFIRKNQLNMEWLMKRAINFGRGMYRVADADGIEVAKWFHIPRYMIRRLIFSEVEVIINMLSSNKKELFKARWNRNFLWGQIIEAYQLSQQAKKVLS